MGRRKKTIVNDDILQAIREAQLSGQTWLDLSRGRVGHFDQLPEELYELVQLERLNLSSQRLTEIPPGIRRLTNLKHIVLTGNPLLRVPDLPGLEIDWITYGRCRTTLTPGNIAGIYVDLDDNGGIVALPKQTNRGLARELRSLALRSLRVGSNFPVTQSTPRPLSKQLRELCDAIDEFPTLEVLCWFGLRLKSVPPKIRHLTRLRDLGLIATELTEIPAWIGELKGIQCLRLGLNNLTDLPESLEQLLDLRVLDLQGNYLSAIPDVVFRMENLVTLNARSWHNSRGRITHVPNAILRLNSLTNLNLEGQPIENPPAEVVANGVDAIRAYWRQRSEVGIDYLCEAKLIVLGEPGAGKTTLAKKLADPTYRLNADEASTEGIDVLRWSFPSAVRVQNDGREELLKTDFKANTWDFGGQEIYHATHQFFLTRRSLYVLVADDRKEDTDFDYWLRVVELLAGNSPLIIVQNEKQDRQRGLDIASLRARFPNLRDSFRTNLGTGRGFDELSAAIRRGLEQLPHVGTPLPKTWSSVRAALESDPRQHIRLDEYLAICERNGFTREADKLQLGGYLHDLGICLHFQDDALLRKTVILKPSWGTDAVYRVLDDPGVLEHRGRFDRSDLARIWSDRGHESMRDELLQLMIRFQLCYELPRGGVYIAPQLLSPERPEYAWPGPSRAILRYDYEFMPKGILTRCIVALHDRIADQRLVWRSGVVLERNGTRAEIIESYAQRNISVRIDGPEVVGMLAIVDDQLTRIHDAFPGLVYERYLPCQCATCGTAPEPYAFKLSELRDFAQAGDAIQCRKSRKLVDAGALLRDLLPSACVPAPIPFGLEHRIEQSQPETIPSKREVFVSYSWKEPSNALVDRLQQTLDAEGIALRRDKQDVGYKSSIREFMQRIGRGQCVVVVISKDYLLSKSCMFELTQIASHGELADRVFPIVMDDADIYEGLSRLDYIEHWEQKKAALDAKMKKVGGEHLAGIREELDLFAQIRGTISNIVDTLADMNTFTRQHHERTDFADLIQALKA